LRTVTSSVLSQKRVSDRLGGSHQLTSLRETFRTWVNSVD
jgi:hypothetical protein